MIKKEHVLDPLWITKGSPGLDPEYYRYILLAADKKYRDKLKVGDISDFYEIVFHSLNLNNLAVDGSIFKFNMTPVWDNSTLKEIRHYLRKLYQLPDNLVEILKSANYLLTSLIIDYLDELLTTSINSRVYFVNPKIHHEKEIYIVISKKLSTEYSIWKLKFDRRLKFGHTINKIRNVKVDKVKDDALKDAVDKLRDPNLASMCANTNICFVITEDHENESSLASFVSNTIIFSKGMLRGHKFNPRILEELSELVKVEKVMPFTMKSWN